MSQSITGLPQNDLGQPRQEVPKRVIRWTLGRSNLIQALSCRCIELNTKGEGQSIYFPSQVFIHMYVGDPDLSLRALGTQKRNSSKCSCKLGQLVIPLHFDLRPVQLNAYFDYIPENYWVFIGANRDASLPWMKHYIRSDSKAACNWNGSSSGVERSVWFTDVTIPRDQDPYIVRRAVTSVGSPKPSRPLLAWSSGITSVEEQAQF